MDIGRRHQVKAGDFEKVHRLLVDASAWLREKGLAQWNRAYPVERFAREVSAGSVWYWSVDGQPIATVTISENRPEYYPPGTWDDCAEAWYLCRFAVARQFGGQHVGEMALASVEHDAAAAQVEVLRVDVATSNPFLERYYARQGFQRHQAIEIFGEGAVLLEKRVRHQRRGV